MIMQRCRPFQLTWHSVKGGLEGAFGHILLVGSFEVELVSLPVSLQLQGNTIPVSQIEVECLNYKQTPLAEIISSSIPVKCAHNLPGPSVPPFCAYHKP